MIKASQNISFAVSIVIVHFNGTKFLEQCLDSIFNNTYVDEREIILVDNASTDTDWKNIPTLQSKRIIKYNHLKILELPENIGFGAACNRGAAIASSKLLFFLNPDVIIENDPIPQMRAFLENTPKAGAIGPKLLFPNGDLQPSRGTFPHLPLTVAQLFKFKRFLPKDELLIPYLHKVLGKYFAQWKQADSVQKVDYITGAALMIKKSIFDECNGFDEHFFLYFEEIDLCKRINLKGYQNFFFPLVKIVHVEDASSEPSYGFKEAAYLKSLIYYYQKYAKQSQRLILKFFIHIYLFFRKLSIWKKSFRRQLLMRKK